MAFILHAMPLPILAALALAASPDATPTFELKQAADPGVHMPQAGIGLGNIGKYGNNSYAAVNATLSFLRLGGRRTDSADSYGDELGIGLALRKFMNETKTLRSDLFIVSKIGPGGLSFPLGFNESQMQARGIVANYSGGSRMITAVDLLLVHWPVNYGPCSYHGPKPSVPTTDVLCDTSLATYSEKGCRISTWRGMVALWKAGLARSIGVSNWNSTHMQDLLDAGLPLPAVNQIAWYPGVLTPGTAFSPEHRGGTPGWTETYSSLLAWCQRHGVLVNGYSPFDSTHALSDPRIAAIGKAHNVSNAQVILRWNIQLGIAINPMSTNPKYQKENLDVFGFNLTVDEMRTLGAWKPSDSVPFTI